MKKFTDDMQMVEQILIHKLYLSHSLYVWAAASSACKKVFDAVTIASWVDVRVPKVRILKETGCQSYSKLEGDMLALWICRIESLEVSNIVIITVILFFRGAFTHPNYYTYLCPWKGTGHWKRVDYQRWWWWWWRSRTCRGGVWVQGGMRGV